jgi:beta-lactamase regulating signal transducer with metallopeptidase domain
MVGTLVDWLIAYTVHSTTLLAAVYVLERARVLVELDVRETAWRTAMLGAFITATLHIALASGAIAPAAQPRLSEAAMIATPVTKQGPPRETTRDSGRETAFEPARTVAAAERPDAENPATFASPRRWTLPIELPRRAIGIGWTSIASAGLILLLMQFLRVLWRYRAARLSLDPTLQSEVSTLAARAGVTVASVLEIEGAISPVVVPPATLCIPTWALTDLAGRQRQAMIAHEVAHLKRRDPWWRLIYLACARAMFFQPLNWIAVRRLDAIAELACDDWAARTTDARALAECLAACGARIVASRQPALMSSMIGSRSTLVARLEALLQREPRLVARVYAARTALLLLVCGVTGLPALVFEGSVQAASDWSVSDMRGSGMRVRNEIDVLRLGYRPVTTMKVKAADGVLGARIEGKIKFSDAEDSVVELDDEAVIEERAGATQRRVEVENADGAIRHRYLVDGHEQPFESEGRRFVGRTVPILLRETTYDAKGRVQRIADRGGADAVLDEIALIRGDHGRATYLAHLAARGPLDEAHLTRALTSVSSVQSDFERRRALTPLLEHQRLSTGHQLQALSLIAEMGSDFEQRMILTRLTTKLAADPAIAEAWRAVLETVRSDFEARTSIVTLASVHELHPAMTDAAIRATHGIGSSFERRMSLTSLAQHLSAAPALAVAYADATRHIQSDFERRMALTRLIRTVELDVAAFKAVVAATKEFRSQFECRNVLRALTDDLPADAEALDLYRSANARCNNDAEI